LECRVLRGERSGVENVTYWLFPNSGLLQGWWADRMAIEGIALDQGGCWDGAVGETDQARGRLACYYDGVNRKVRWTDDERRIYGAVNGTSGGGRADLRSVVEWWAERAMTVETEPVFSDDEQFLLDQVPDPLRSSCVPYRHVHKDGLVSGGQHPVGDIAAIDCFPADQGIDHVGYFLFSDHDDLVAHYQGRMGDSRIAPDSGGCRDGNAGETSWDGGRLFCYSSSGGPARIRWMDETALIYGEGNASEGEILGFFQWWDHNAVR
jgi:hypothetical protein